jgi:DNA-binding NarL/FixJ family response regulator
MSRREEGRGSLSSGAATALGLERAFEKPYRILLVDDHPVVRRGIRLMLAPHPGLEICGEASNGVAAVEMAKKEKPNLVILDLTLPEMNGLDASRAIREALPETNVLVLSMHFSEDLAREVLRAGALGYVLKSDADIELLSAVDHARRGQPFFTTALATTMAHNFINGYSAAPSGEALPGTNLTQREVEVVRMLAEGKSNKEVAAALSVSTRTVESHRNHIMRKMNFTSFSDLVRFAVRASLIAP